MPSHVPKVERGCSKRISWSFAAISIDDAERLDQARITHREKRTLVDDAQVNEDECRSDSEDREQIENVEMDAGAMQFRQDDDIHVDQLHEDDPAGDDAEPL